VFNSLVAAEVEHESSPVGMLAAGGVGNDAMVIHADVTAHPKP